MTNPDNVGGLLPCPFCGGAAERIDFGPGSGDNEGGSCIACTKCQASGPVEFGYKENFVSNWNRRELCRAAPAGGVPEWIREEFVGMRDRMQAISDKCAARLAELDSAPAGSGEVEEMASRLVSMSNGLHSAHLCTDLRRAAALLRKLQQGAGYVMVPRVPTEAMRAAFTAESMPAFAAMTTIRIGDFGERYRYMIAASQDQEG